MALLCVAGAIAYRMHVRLRAWVARHRPSPFNRSSSVIISNLSAHETVWVVHYARAGAEPPWFRADLGRAAYGDTARTDATCRTPTDVLLNALRQAARCFPHARHFVHAEANASEEDAAQARAYGAPPAACRLAGLLLVPRAALERCAAPDCLDAAPPCEATPQLCVALTFPAHRTDDPLKRLAHQNTARMYAALWPRVRAFAKDAIEGLAPLSEAPATNAHGTPLLSSLLERVRDACPRAPLVGYANADILFDGGLLTTLDALLRWNAPAFLAVGRRRNHPLRDVLTIDNVSAADGELFVEVAQDYFLMPRGVVDALRASLPPYVIGRRAYDNALNDWAFHRAFLVDLTDTVTALHQTTADGNYAGHSPRNADMEYNVQLPGATYDHGATTHAQYATVRLPGGAVAVRRKSDVWLSHPEVDCISGTSTVGCRDFADGARLASLLDRDEAEALSQWPLSGPIDGPALVRSDGAVCAPHRYAGGGCGGPVTASEDPCPPPDAAVAFVVVATQFWGEGYFHMVVEGLRARRAGADRAPRLLSRTHRARAQPVPARGGLRRAPGPRRRLGPRPGDPRPARAPAHSVRRPPTQRARALAARAAVARPPSAQRAHGALGGP